MHWLTFLIRWRKSWQQTRASRFVLARLTSRMYLTTMMSFSFLSFKKKKQIDYYYFLNKIVQSSKKKMFIFYFLLVCVVAFVVWIVKRRNCTWKLDYAPIGTIYLCVLLWFWFWCWCWFCGFVFVFFLFLFLFCFLFFVLFLFLFWFVLLTQHHKQQTKLQQILFLVGCCATKVFFLFLFLTCAFCCWRAVLFVTRRTAIPSIFKPVKWKDFIYSFWRNIKHIYM